MAFIGALVVIFGVVLLVAISRGFVLTFMWNWFVMPLSESLPELGVAHAIGICLIVGYLVPLHSMKTDDEDVKSRLITACLLPWLTLLLAWIVALFM